MDKKRIIEKANQAIKKQSETRDILYELTDELLVLRKENEKLKQELALAKTEEPVIETKGTVVIEEEIKTTSSRKAEKAIFKDQEKDASKTMVTPSKESAIEKLRVEQANASNERTTTKPHSSSISEFFLGKNIIAKIASILIFLGFVSFGQIAYINWLNDIGRFILILFIGIAFFIGGYLFEKRDNQVFNNVFYAIGLVVIFLSFMLAFATYDLINYTAFLYVTIIFIGLAFGYFNNKRYDFLDSFLFIFYLVVFGYLIFYGNEVASITLFDYIGIILGLIVLGYIMYAYILKYKEIKQKLQAAGIAFFAIEFMVLIRFLVIGFSYSLSAYSIAIPLIFLITIFIIYTLYLINLKFFEKEDYYLVILIISSLLLSYGAAQGIFGILQEYNLIVNYIHLVLFMIVLLTPMYAYLFTKDKASPKEVSRLDYYAIVISFFILIYVLTFSKFSGNSTPVVFYIRNMILGGVTIASYLLYRLTKKISYMRISYIYFGVLGITVFVRYLTVTSVSSHSRFFEFNNYYLLEVSNTEFIIYLSSLIVGIVLLAINKWYGRRKEEVCEESLVLYGFNLYVLIPIVFLIVNAYQDSMASRFGIILLSIMSIVIILYRYLLNLKVFRVKHLKEFKVGIQVVVVLFIMFINFIYFDHNFALGIDLITFSMVMVLNLYVMVSLKEIYDYAKEKYELEKAFITAYLVGVFIQSMFIHRYINFTYDKVFLSSYFIIASALAILYGFRNKLLLVRKLGLGAIYFSLIKFFTYDFFGAEFTLTVRTITYFILGLLLMAIAFMYSYLEKKYGENI